ncbi:MAG TPA: tetratricopeptide repeat protein [Nitrospirota bacterium]|nr:tetratricopeptide repeat protein [Nitrospirota bacterium]
MDKETSEIAKLTERIAKDPKSKLFVPLAEEYKKAGDMEMSIHVLTEGLKNNPGYVTARSFLGKLLIEKGDLPGAQKEFEEVIKAIPDNLMAQRKLGDLHALQNRPDNALNHYKIVLSLNPKDSETAKLVAEAEAGRDIKQYLARPKVSEEPARKQERAPAGRPQTGTRQQPLTGAAAGMQGGLPSGTAMAPADEEPEEVLVVEPIDAVEAAPAAAESDLLPPPAVMDFLSEPAQDAAQPAEEEAADALFALNEPFAVEDLPEQARPEGSEDTLADLNQPFTLQEPLAKDEEETASDALFALNEPFAVEEPVAPFDESPSQLDVHPGTAAEPAEETAKRSDDFTTDTLAELYISQGFFEKAVDIYERMLVDNPNSKGLKDKLAHVRAMAAAAAPADTADSEAASLAMDTEGVPDQEEPKNSREADIFTAPSAEQPRLDDWELSATRVTPDAGRDMPKAAGTRTQPKHFDVGFEPREYVPPDAVPRRPAPDAADAPRGPVQTQPGQTAGKRESGERPSTARRKETVDRLESWLKNIKKES